MSCDPITKMSKLKPPLQVRTSCPATIPPTQQNLLYKRLLRLVAKNESS